MKLNEIILAGVKHGVDRHWHYAKDYLKVKPEYLLTVSVADELITPMGLETSIKLEEPTIDVVFTLREKALGWVQHFKTWVQWAGRHGRVDLFIKTDDVCHVIELKNFDPSATEIKKELERFEAFFAVNNYENHLKSCHIAFPSMGNKEQWIQKHTENYNTSPIFQLKTLFDYFETGSDPDDGVPAYYVNVVSLMRK